MLRCQAAWDTQKIWSGVLISERQAIEISFVLPELLGCFLMGGTRVPPPGS